MNLFKWANQGVQKFSWLDVKFVAWSGICIGIILVKILPQVLKLNVWYFIVLGTTCLIRPYYLIFTSKK